MSSSSSCSSDPRVVGFIDMDAFYIAVEMQGPFKADLAADKPAAVVQYNSGEKNTADCAADDRKRFDVKTGTIIAVNYPARARGVKRNMPGREAHKACPELVLVRVPTKHGKADLTIYKQAGNNVVSILKSRAAACEKRSVDEVAIDITPESDRLLAEEPFAAVVHRARAAVRRPRATVRRARADRRHARARTHRFRGACVFVGVCDVCEHASARRPCRSSS